MSVTVRVTMTFVTSRGNTDSLVEDDETDKSDHDGNAEQDVLVAIGDNQSDVLRAVLANEDLGKEMEKSVAHETTKGKSDHGVQGCWVNV